MKHKVGLHPQPSKNTLLAQPLNWGVKVSPLKLLPKLSNYFVTHLWHRGVSYSRGILFA